MNLFFSCFSAVFVLLLELLYPLRKLAQKQKPKEGSAWMTAYKILRKVHIAIGILVIPVVFCHCSLATRAAGKQSLFGAVLLFLLLLLALTYFLRKPLGKWWKPLHQWLAAILMGITLYHSFIEFL